MARNANNNNVYDHEILNDVRYLTNYIQSLDLDEDETSPLPQHHECPCNFCSKANFIGYRYRCLVCDDYNLCSECYENKRTNQSHKIRHLMVRYDDPDTLFGRRVTPSQVSLNYFVNTYATEIHEDLKCSDCGMEPMKGVRIKCETCHNYDACYECYEKNRLNELASHDYENHQVLLIAKEVCLRVDKNDIEIMEKIGKGGFGSVFKAKYKNKLVACKQIVVSNSKCQMHGVDPNEFGRTYLRELNAYNEIKSDHILKMLGYRINKTESRIEFIILTEFMPKGSLTKLIKSEPDLSYLKRLNLAVNIASGMSRIHDLGFIHRDIRPDNILVDANYVAKIGDMGIAKEFNPQDPKHSTNLGCLEYMPPEFYSGKYNKKLDIYTFGLTLNELYNGSHRLVLTKIQIDKKAPVLDFFVDRCLNFDAAKRPAAKELETELKQFNQVIKSTIRNLIKNYDRLAVCEKRDVFIRAYETCLEIYEKNGFSFPSKYIHFN